MESTSRVADSLGPMGPTGETLADRRGLWRSWETVHDWEAPVAADESASDSVASDWTQLAILTQPILMLAAVGGQNARPTASAQP